MNVTHRFGYMTWFRLPVQLAHLVFLVLVVLVPSFPSMAQSQPPQVGYRDYSFGTSFSSTGPTGEKPQSKLWFNDGIWWGSMIHPPSLTYHIYRLDMSTQTWSDTGVQLDNRKSTRADCLWDAAAKKLYVAHNPFSTNGTVKSSSAQWARVYRFSYNSSTKSYSLDSGFPVNVNRGTSETIVIAKDTAGILWVTFTQSAHVWVAHSLPGSENQWVDPFMPPAPATSTSLSTDDISSIVAFGPGKVGVLWSNQLTKKYHFMVHNDADPDTTWQPEETALPAPGGIENSDDHINLKTDGSGRVFAALKTSLTSSTQPLVELAVRGAGGGWSSYVFGRVRDKHTRPIVLLDTEHNRLYLFAESPDGTTVPAGVYYKTSSMSSISFPLDLGAPFIKTSTDVKINDVTSTQQNLGSSTGLVVLASDTTSGYYLHNFLTLSGGTQPAISSFSPTKAPPGVVVTIKGSGLSAAAVVGFNGQPAQFIIDSDTQIRATVPTGSKTGLLTVSTQSGLVGTSSGSFTVTGLPVVNSFTPASGTMGTNVTLSGTGFTATSAVTFNGVNAAFTVSSDTKLTAVVPSGATTGRIAVTNPAGTGVSSTDFTVTP